MKIPLLLSLAAVALTGCHTVYVVQTVPDNGYHPAGVAVPASQQYVETRTVYGWWDYPDLNPERVTRRMQTDPLFPPSPAVEHPER